MEIFLLRNFAGTRRQIVSRKNTAVVGVLISADSSCRTVFILFVVLSILHNIILSIQTYLIDGVGFGEFNSPFNLYDRQNISFLSKHPFEDTNSKPIVNGTENHFLIY